MPNFSVDRIIFHRYLIQENRYETIMRSHAILRWLRDDLGHGAADNLFSCPHGGGAYDRGI